MGRIYLIHLFEFKGVSNSKESEDFSAELSSHIVQRGHNRKAAFLADEDYQYYL